MKITVIAAAYNPSNYDIRRRNREIFVENLEKRKIPLLEVEFSPDGRFSGSEGSIRISEGHHAWQKERLINLGAAEAFRRGADAVAWIDNDLLLSPNDWFERLERELETCDLVQIGDLYTWLAPGERKYNGAILYRNPSVGGLYRRLGRDEYLRLERETKQTGHMGFAWAATRRFWESIGGLPDRHISGIGDYWFYRSAIVAAASPDPEDDETLSPYGRYLRDWDRRLRRTPFEFGCVVCDVHHLWHGTWRDRRYFEMHQHLERLRFDPLRDVYTKADSALFWRNPRSAVATASGSHFRNRREDG